jgi:hypothetical protein
MDEFAMSRQRHRKNNRLQPAENRPSTRQSSHSSNNTQRPPRRPQPSVLICKRFGEEIKIDYYPSTSAAECSLIREMRVEEGKEKIGKNQQLPLSRAKVAVPRKIFR